ncbi:MAG: hypothetical protein AAB352_00235 [Patescibacteria group bacterium]
MVVVQFSFTNPAAIPEVVKRTEKESPAEHKERKTHSNGVLVIEPTPGCGLVEFPLGLEQAGFELVDASYKERIDPKDPRQRRTYHMVRFVFCRRESAELSDEFRSVRDEIRFALQNMAENAMWRVRVFDNPFFFKDEEVQDQRALSVNLAARDTIVQPNGELIKRWEKDDQGNRIGEGPVPIVPKRQLCVRGGTVQIVPA